MNDTTIPEAKPVELRSSGPTPTVLDVRQIGFYARNPRRSENPEYERIKASIRAEGMIVPLVVTRVPGADAYIVAAGGNTRLKILNELHEETRDGRFAEVPCLVRPWAGEVDVLLAHLKENDLRGDLTFIDKARAIIDVVELLQGEASNEPVTQRQVVALLKDRGYDVSQSVYSLMEYAVARLLPCLPTVLADGIGRPQIERIRMLDRAAQAMWNTYLPGEGDAYEAAFKGLCERHDGADWDVELLRRGLELEIAEEAELDLDAVRLEMAARLAGRTVIASTPASETVEDPESDARSSDHSAADDAAPKPLTSNAHDDRPNPSPAAPTVWGDDERSSDGDHIPASPDAPSDVSAARPAPTPTDLKSLRARAWTLAIRLAQRHGLGELIAPLTATGLGFVLRDVPDAALLEQIDEDELAQVSTLWWQLAACCEITVAPLACILPLLDPDTVLHRALENQDAALLFRNVWTLDPGHTGYRLWRRIDDRSWRDLTDLQENYRALYSAAQANNVVLWEHCT